MRLGPLVVLLLSLSLPAHSEDNISRVHKAIERSTLAQPGTPPFHLKATLAPSFERDQASNRTGTVEIWWASPTQWKSDLNIPGLHIVEITDGTHHWQHSEGVYFPDWLREISIALIDPVPNKDQLFDHLKTAEVRNLANALDFSWAEFSSNGDVSKSMGAGISIDGSSGLLLYGSGFGWNFQYKDYSPFHKLLVARTVSASGASGPEVTAKISTLEGLGSVPTGFLDTTQPGADSNPLLTTLLDEPTLRKNLLPGPLPTWPALKDGPLEGVSTTEIIVDREGNVHEVGTPISDNPGTDAALNDYITSLHFQPYLLNGQPVQVFSRITLAFKTTRPAGMETFDSARNFFDRGRTLTSPAAAATITPYILHATFETGTKDGIKKGEYTDTLLSPTQWCREATLDKSRFARCRNGEKWYRISEGTEAPLLGLVLKAIEPTPVTTDSWYEADWRFNRQTINGVSLVRIARGHESSDGTLDAESSGLWFDSNGFLIRAHFHGLDTVQSQFQDFHGTQVPREIRVLSNGKVGMLIRVATVDPATNLSAKAFTLSGHDWKRQFTDETR